MQTTSLLVVLFPNRYVVVRHDGTAVGFNVEFDEPASVAKAVVGYLDNNGLSKSRLVFALDRDFCLCASFQTAVRNQAERELRFEFEEWLPISIEDATICLVRHKANVLGIAIQNDLWLPFFRQLEMDKVRVNSVVPLAFLALQAATKTIRNGEATASFTAQGSVHLSEGIPTEWLTDRRLSVVDAGEHVEFELPDSLRTSVVHTNEQCAIIDSKTLASTAQRIANRKTKPYAELRTGKLADPSEKKGLEWIRAVAMLSGMLAIAVVAAVLLWKAHQFRSISTEFRDEQVAIFKQTFPERKTPVGVRKHLVSEYRRLRGTSGGDGYVPRSPQVDELLFDILSWQPTELRFQFSEVRIEEGGFVISGAVRSHADAETIASALREKGYSVDLPSTRQLADGGVSFRIAGSRPVENEGGLE